MEFDFQETLSDFLPKQITAYPKSSSNLSGRQVKPEELEPVVGTTAIDLTKWWRVKQLNTSDCTSSDEQHYLHFCGSWFKGHYNNLAKHESHCKIAQMEKDSNVFFHLFLKPAKRDRNRSKDLDSSKLHDSNMKL